MLLSPQSVAVDLGAEGWEGKVRERWRPGTECAVTVVPTQIKPRLKSGCDTCLQIGTDSFKAEQPSCRAYKVRILTTRVVVP